MKFLRSFLLFAVILIPIVFINENIHAAAPNPVEALQQYQPQGTANFETNSDATQQTATGAIWVKVWKVVSVLIMASGIVAIFALISTGFNYVISFGVPEKLEAAKKSFFWAIGGLVVVILAYFLVQTIIDILLFIGVPGEETQGTAGSGTSPAANPGS